MIEANVSLTSARNQRRQLLRIHTYSSHTPYFSHCQIQNMKKVNKLGTHKQQERAVSRACGSNVFGLPSGLFRIIEGLKAPLPDTAFILKVNHENMT